ncbi:MAG: hypothetical protein R3274_11465 [Desulfobacterales bacterium]|nr:hypothetical protein [Desulfobacterales bacterium]
MKVTICELRNRPDRFEQEWNALIEHVTSAASELVLLPEMPFYPWLASTRITRDPAQMVPIGAKLAG